MPQNAPWHKSAVFYELHLRAFKDSSGDGNGDLRGLIEKLDYLQDLGITCIWLLPIFPSPLKDGGYDISDFMDIHPRYGTIQHFKELISAAHARDIRIITDLVLNHTSDQHPWFQAARSDPKSQYRDYYVWSDTSDKYLDSRIIFTDTEDSNWTWDEKAGQFYWHRFFSHQPDLNYDNPAIHQEMFSIMQFWLDLGIDGFRLDAIPYLYEREGTNSENLPETHDFLKSARAFVDENYPDAVLLSEANQWPEDIVPYFGEEDEMHMAFHFPLMPRIFMSLRQGNTQAIRDILDRTPDIPQSAQWCLFLRNHDELTLEMVTPEERDWMWQEFAPGPQMRLNFGIRRRLAPLLDNDKQSILLAHSIILTLPGSPVLYYGDEIGMGDDVMREDRDGVRTPMQWNASPNADFSPVDPEQLYSPPISGASFAPNFVNVEEQNKDTNSLLITLKHLLTVRQQNPAFAQGTFSWLEEAPNSILAYMRTLDNNSLLVLNNLSNDFINFSFPWKSQYPPIDLLNNQVRGKLASQQLTISIAPHEFLWLEMD